MSQFFLSCRVELADEAATDRLAASLAGAIEGVHERPERPGPVEPPGLAGLAGPPGLVEPSGSAGPPGRWHLHLSGDLGAGKTRFTRGLLRALGHEGRVRSPTFTLFEPYELAKFPLYHFDFYRFTSDNDWRDVGFDEWLSDENAVVVIEWPEMAGGQLPTPDLRLAFECAADDRRVLRIHAFSARGNAWLNTIPTMFPDLPASLSRSP